MQGDVARPDIQMAVLGQGRAADAESGPDRRCDDPEAHDRDPPWRG
jgi:hypothetical protein